MFFREQAIDLDDLSSKNEGFNSFLPLYNKVDPELIKRYGQNRLGFSLKKNTKERFHFWIDKDILVWYKSFGANYQTKMNAALRSLMENEKIENEKSA